MIHFICVKKIDPRAIIPTYVSKANVGAYKLHCLDDVVIPSGKTQVIRTGLFMTIPEGFVAEIVPIPYMQTHEDFDIARMTLTAADDPEIKIVITNNSDVSCEFKSGSAVARLIFLPVACPEIRDVTPTFIANQIK